MSDAAFLRTSVKEPRAQNSVTMQIGLKHSPISMATLGLHDTVGLYTTFELYSIVKCTRQKNCRIHDSCRKNCIPQRIGTRLHSCTANQAQKAKISAQQKTLQEQQQTRHLLAYCSHYGHLHQNHPSSDRHGMMS